MLVVSPDCKVLQVFDQVWDCADTGDWGRGMVLTISRAANKTSRKFQQLMVNIGEDKQAIKLALAHLRIY